MKVVTIEGPGRWDFCSWNYALINARLSEWLDGNPGRSMLFEHVPHEWQTASLTLEGPFSYSGEVERWTTKTRWLSEAAGTLLDEMQRRGEVFEDYYLGN